MESHSNLPPATGTNFHITNAAVNNDALINHPPYNEMITAAIIAMKERGGSSRQAIAKYIESEYKNLSPCHATLLTQQLRKMKNQGQLILNKHSFMLSGGNSQSFVKGSVVRKRRPGRPPKIPSSGGGVGGVASPSVSCVSGLPVISAPSVMVGAVPMVVPMGEVDGETPVKRRPGGPPTLQTIVAEVEPGAGTETVSVGRRLGRPPKNNNGIVGVGTGGGGSVLGKRGRRCVVMEAAIVSASLGNSDDVEWGCGRPYKIGAVSSSGHSDGGAILVPIEGMGGAGRASEIDARRPTKQSEDNKAAPIALGGLREVGGIPMMCAPVSKIELRDQGGPGRDPVEPLCAQYQKFCI